MVLKKFLSKLFSGSYWKYWSERLMAKRLEKALGSEWIHISEIQHELPNNFSYNNWSSPGVTRLCAAQKDIMHSIASAIEQGNLKPQIFEKKVPLGIAWEIRQRRSKIDAAFRIADLMPVLMSVSSGELKAGTLSLQEHSTTESFELPEGKVHFIEAVSLVAKALHSRKGTLTLLAEARKEPVPDQPESSSIPVAARPLAAVLE